MGSREVIDQFGRICNCEDGQLESCSRYRQDWAMLTDGEKQLYISAVLTVATDPRYQPLYNLLIKRYQESGPTLAQGTTPETSQFFPWHRYFLLEYEDLLRLVNSSITIPYWDWTLLPTDPYSSPVFDPVTGFGNSSNSTTTCVTSGPFREEVFQVTPSAGKGCLRRTYNDFTFPSRSIIQSEALDFPASMFDDFHRSLQLFFHLNIRCFVGGHMCEPNAGNDPLYLLHLARIDLILDSWQSMDTARATVRYAGDNTPLVLTFDDELIVSNFFSNGNLPYNVSVQYAPLQIIMDAPLMNDTTDVSLNTTSVDPTRTPTPIAISTPTVTGYTPSATATPEPTSTTQTSVFQDNAAPLQFADSSCTHAFAMYFKTTCILVTVVAIWFLY